MKTAGALAASAAVLTAALEAAFARCVSAQMSPPPPIFVTRPLAGPLSFVSALLDSSASSHARCPICFREAFQGGVGPVVGRDSPETRRRPQDRQAVAQGRRPAQRPLSPGPTGPGRGLRARSPVHRVTHKRACKMTVGTYVDKGDARLAFEGPVLALNTQAQAAATAASEAAFACGEKE